MVFLIILQEERRGGGGGGEGHSIETMASFKQNMREVKQFHADTNPDITISMYKIIQYN